MLTYIALAITYILAMSGVLFKTTRTAADGSTLRRNNGLPVLTWAGYLTMALLTLSVVIAVYTTWDQRRRADEDKRALKSQLEALKEPLGNIFISFVADVSLAHPGLRPYHARLVRAADAWHRLERSFNPAYETVDPRGLSFVLVASHPSDLLPQQPSEKYAYALLNSWQLTVMIYKKALTLDQLLLRNWPPDLELVVGSALSRDPEIPDWFTGSTKIRWNLDSKPELLTLIAQDCLVRVENQRRTSDVSAFQDLVGAQVVAALTPEPFTYRFKDSPSPDPRNLVTLREFWIKVAGGRELFVPKPIRHENPDQQRYPFYVAKLGVSP